MNDTIKGALIGAIIPTVGAFVIFFLGDFSTQSKLERDTVQVLSEKFNSVEKDMSYEDALQAIFKENENLKVELNSLQIQIDTINSKEEINKVIQNATNYGNSSDYVQALSILNSVKDKTPEIKNLITNYSQKYELKIIEQANNLKAEEKLDDASNLISDALNILPNSQTLKNKLQEIKDSYPQNMVDVVPAYQSGGNGYKEYSMVKEGSTDYFTMAGVKYTNDITFDADINILSDNITWAVYNLNNEYKSLEFIVGHVDYTYLGNETSLQIFYDGIFQKEISLKPDMMPQPISLDITGVTQLKMQVSASGLDHPLYGLGNPILK